MFADGCPDRFRKGHPAVPDGAKFGTMPPLQVATLNDEIVSHIVLVEDLVPCNPEEFLNAKAGAATKHQEEAVARVHGAGEVLDEAGILGLCERSGWHSPELRLAWCCRPVTAVRRASTCRCLRRPARCDLLDCELVVIDSSGALACIPAGPTVAVLRLRLS